MNSTCRRGGHDLKFLFPLTSYLKRLAKGSSLLVNKFHKKFKLHCRKINIVRCVWIIELDHITINLAESLVLTRT